MLLFWPCAWGLTLAYDFSKNLNDYFFYLSLFFLGSILMRSAGCIVNDISDKEFETVLRGGLAAKATGVMMFTTSSVAKSEGKTEVLRKVYTEMKAKTQK